jgi:hypothetical protein
MKFLSVSSNPASPGHSLFTFVSDDGTDELERMRIDSSGNVGIGTTNPGNILNIYDSAAGSAGTSASPDWSDSLFLQRNIPSNYQGTRILFAHGKASIGGFREDNTEDGAHHLAFYTGGNISGINEAMRITNTGNVGIGTTNPFSKLDVDGIIEAGNTSSTGGAVGLRIKYSGATDDYINNFGSMYSSSVSLIGYAVRSSGAESGKFLSTADNANFSRGALLVGGELEYLSAGPQITTVGDEVPLTSRFKILLNGNVGLGTTNPTANLHVVGDNAVPGSQGFIKISNNVNGDAGIIGDSIALMTGGVANQLAIRSGSAGVVLGVGSSPKMIIDSNGNVGIGTTNPLSDFVVKGGSDNTATSFEIVSSNNSATIELLQRDNSNTASPLKFRAERYIFLGGADGSTGNVGIGTTDTSSYKLHVNGSVFASSYYPTSDDRVKHNEQNIVGAIETLSKITPKKYIKTTEMYDANHNFELDADGNPIDESGEPVEHRIEAGVIAQQVLAVDELAFAVSAEGVDEDGVATSPHGLDYNSLFTYAIAAMQEQQKLIESQQSKINDLVSRVEYLES